MAIAKISRAVTGITLAVALSACTTQFRNHGYAPSDAELQEIIVGVDTRATVEDVIGRPSTSGVLTGSAYYYLSDRRSSFAFFEPGSCSFSNTSVNFLIPAAWHNDFLSDALLDSRGILLGLQYHQFYVGVTAGILHRSRKPWRLHPFRMCFWYAGSLLQESSSD